MSDKYMKLKSKADTCFKELKFNEAVKLYEQTLAIVGDDSIVPNSNISACYFELGKIFL